jgi:hypothetical protein
MTLKCYVDYALVFKMLILLTSRVDEGTQNLHFYPRRPGTRRDLAQAGSGFRFAPQ